MNSPTEMKTELHPKRFRKQYPMILNNSEKHNQHDFQCHDNRVSTNAKNMKLTHFPSRPWCKTCVAAKARQMHHTKQPDRRDCSQLDLGFLTQSNRQDAVPVVTDAQHTTETLILFVLSFKYETGRTHTDTNRWRRSNESLSENSFTTNWNPNVHESSILEWKRWSDRAMHTDTLGSTSNLTNTDERQISEVANPNDSSDCRLGHSTCFLDSDTILATCWRENFMWTTMANDHTHHHCASLAKRQCMLNRRRSYRNTPHDSTKHLGWMVVSCFEPE